MTIAIIICNIAVVLTQLVKLLFVVATLVFLWGVIKYVIAGGGGDEKKLAEAKNYIIYGLVGLFVMLAMWGIVFAVFKTTFGTNSTPFIPTLSCPTTAPSPVLTPSPFPLRPDQLQI